MEMGNQAKKEYLLRYRDALIKQRMIEDEIRELRLNKMVPSLIQDGMPHGTVVGDLSGYMAKLDALLNDLDRQAQSCIDIRREIVEKIECMQNETEKLLLRLRYINGKKWEEIAMEMNLDVRWVYRLHGRALQHFSN